MQAMRPLAVVFPVGDLNACTALPARTVGSGGVLLGGEDAKARAAEGEAKSDPTLTHVYLYTYPKLSLLFRAQ